MSIKRITYQGKTQSVIDWANELSIKANTIYSRLSLGWPPELVLSKKRFHYCTSYTAANRLQACRDYPFIHHKENTTSCCTKDSICKWAIPISPWNEVADHPAKGNYYCTYKSRDYGDFVKGINPSC